jgi:glycine betaine/proline transport system permease protein/glycine betaine/proline transport system substrate-binding protein
MKRGVEMVRRKWSLLILPILVVMLFVAGCSGDSQTPKKEVTLKFADAGWDSIKFHNAVAMFILQKGMDYKTEEVTGTTPLTYQALKKGDIDIYMETWSDNLPTYQEDVAKGNVLELSINFDDNAQGLYVPRYVIEGDAKRNIPAKAPGLKTVEDLKKYKAVFADLESPGKGRIYGAIPGWEVDTILYKKYVNYGFENDFTYFRPGSDAALAAVFTSAYEKGEAVVGYYWSPTWLTGKYDLVRLQDTPYDKAGYKEGKGDFPAVPVTVAATKGIAQKAPEAADFLKKYKTSSEITAKALAHMSETKASYEDTAKWFLQTNEALWMKWVTAQQAEKVKAALK